MVRDKKRNRRKMIFLIKKKTGYFEELKPLQFVKRISGWERTIFVRIIKFMESQIKINW